MEIIIIIVGYDMNIPFIKASSFQPHFSLLPMALSPTLNRCCFSWTHLPSSTQWLAFIQLLSHKHLHCRKYHLPFGISGGMIAA